MKNTEMANERIFDLSTEIEGISNNCIIIANSAENASASILFNALSGIAEHLQRIADDLAEMDFGKGATA